MKDSPYYHQAELAVRVIPFIYQEKVMSIKGGTAINYFVRNLSRLSVDIDLTYVPLEDRAHSLNIITASIHRISQRIKRNIPNVSVRPKRLSDGTVSTLFIQRESIQIKVEANLVIRGTIFPCQNIEICEEGRSLFNQSPKARISSLQDLLGRNMLKQ
jgi:predicted nucleotidyltransferase component of viral defense system